MALRTYRRCRRGRGIGDFLADWSKQNETSGPDTRQSIRSEYSLDSWRSRGGRLRAIAFGADILSLGRWPPLATQRDRTQYECNDTELLPVFQFFDEAFDHARKHIVIR